MATALTVAAIVEQRWGQPWLVGAGTEDFWSHLQRCQASLQEHPYQNVMLVEAEPIPFLAAFLAACQQSGRVWLANPQWGLQEWQQVAEQCVPDLIIGTLSPAMVSVWGDRAIYHPTHDNFTPIEATSDYPTARGGMAMPCPHQNFNTSKDRSPTQILIPTGGSSGNLRFAVHTWETLSASVQGFQQHFQSPVVNAYCVLPLFHVSGLMQAMRCLLSGGQLILQRFHTLLQAGAIASPSDNLFLSLVPTQLQRLLSRDRDFIPWLRRFTAILLGGAPPWPRLLQSARALQLPLAPTYGMTETASQVATLLPAEFLAGNTSSGRALPHARITICNDTGNSLSPNQTGHISIEAGSLAQGYHQSPFTRPLQSGDLGYLDAAGYLHVLGRQTTLIITGGEKVLPEEVEAAILATDKVRDVAVMGVPDQEWGEVVVAVVVPAEAPPVISQSTQNTRAHPLVHWERDRAYRLRQQLKSQLSPYKIPKHWFTCASLPRNPQGKLNRKVLSKWVRQQLQQPPTVPTSHSVLGPDDSAAE